MTEIELVNIVDMKGYHIDVGIDVIPTETRSTLNEINKYLDRCRDMKIASNDDFIAMSDELKKVKSIIIKIEYCHGIMLKPVNGLKNKIDGVFKPISHDANYTKSCMDMLILDWKADVTRKRNEEKVENARKAKEEEDKLKKELDIQAFEEKKKADTFEIQRKAKIEDRKEFERKKIEEQRNACQITNKIECAKKEIEKDPSKAEDIGKEIGILERQKNIAEEVIKKIDTDVGNVKNDIKLISAEEMNRKRRAQKLITEKDALVVAPKKPLTEKVPKINGVTFAKYIKYRIIDINQVPKEYTNVSIVVDDNKVREAVRLKGMNLQIPGIEIYEEEIVRSSSY